PYCACSVMAVTSRSSLPAPAQDQTLVGVREEAAQGKADEGVHRHVGGATLELAVKRREGDRPLLGAAAGDVDGVRERFSGRGPMALPLGQRPEKNRARGATRAGERAGDGCDPRLGVGLAEAIDAELDRR